MKKFNQLVIFLFFFCTVGAMAQEKSDFFTYKFGADLMSKFVWRGAQIGGSYPSIQPWAELGIGPVKFGVWGAYAIGGADPFQEFDLYLRMNFADDLFTVTLNDYYVLGSTPYHYFQYKKDATGHVLEGMFSFNGTEKIPLSLLVALNFYGADAEKINDDPTSIEFNKKAGLQYSNYIELGYAFTMQEMKMNAFAGMTLNNPKKPNLMNGFKGETGFYGTGPGLVNLGVKASKSLNITNLYALPLCCAIIANPQAHHVFIVFGVSL
jgi:hypothetical protein